MPITNLSSFIQPEEIAPAMATDKEFQEAIAAHVAAPNPHPTYGDKNENIIFRGTTPSADGFLSIPHTLDISRVVAVTGVVLEVGGALVTPSLSAKITPGLEFCLSFTPTHIHYHNVVGNSFNLSNRPLKVTVSCEIL